MFSEWGQTHSPSTGGSVTRRGFYGYNNADELTSALIKNQEGTITDQFTWSYDAAGNRLSEQHGSSTRTWAANSFNQLTGQGTVVELKGTVDRASTVKINGVTATMNGLQWSAQVPVTQSQASLEVQETTAADGGTPQKVWGTVQLPASTAASYAYDANGNMLSDGERTYKWDAENRLIEIASMNLGRSTFKYDGLSRRVGLQETSGTGELTCAFNIYCDGMQAVEERQQLHPQVRRFWNLGEQSINLEGGMANSVTIEDHLGTPRASIDISGNLSIGYLVDEWGRRERYEGGVDLQLGYTGHFDHAPSGILLSPSRAYSPSIGRWLSRDWPVNVELREGANLYSYVGNAPMIFVDETGFGKVGFAVRVAKKIWKTVSKNQARRALQKGKDVRVTGPGKSKKGRQLAREKWGDKTVRHPGHKPGQMDHYQHKNGGDCHVFFRSLGEAIAFLNPFSDVQDALDWMDEAGWDERLHFNPGASFEQMW